MKRCSNCGNIWEDEAKFCKTCGSQLVEQEVPKEKKTKKPLMRIIVAVVILAVIVTAGLVVYNNVKYKYKIVGTWQQTGSGMYIEFCKDGIGKMYYDKSDYSTFFYEIKGKTLKIGDLDDLSVVTISIKGDVMTGTYYSNGDKKVETYVRIE